MTSIDQENIRRAQAERRIAMQNSGEGSSATWFLGIVVIVAIIGGILLLGSGGGEGTADGAAPVAAEEVAPAMTDEAAPATTVTE